MTNFARISLFASAAYVAATEIQGLLIFNMDWYIAQRWHTTFLYWGVILICAIVNIQGSSVFPHIETIAFIHHTCFFFVFLVPLVYLSPQSTTAFVFTDFENPSGWSSSGVSLGIGLLASAWAFVGKDIHILCLGGYYLLLTTQVGIDGTSHMSMFSIYTRTLIVTYLCVYRRGSKKLYKGGSPKYDVRLLDQRHSGACHIHCDPLQCWRPHHGLEHTHQLSHHRNIPSGNTVEKSYDGNHSSALSSKFLRFLWDIGFGVSSHVGFCSRQRYSFCTVSGTRKQFFPLFAAFSSEKFFFVSY